MRLTLGDRVYYKDETYEIISESADGRVLRIDNGRLSTEVSHDDIRYACPKCHKKVAHE